MFRWTAGRDTIYGEPGQERRAAAGGAGEVRRRAAGGGVLPSLAGGLRGVAQGGRRPVARVLRLRGGVWWLARRRSRRERRGAAKDRRGCGTSSRAGRATGWRC